jgi:hypothetical protein
MSMEAAAVVAKDGSVIRWHAPPGRSSVALPDSQDLWDVVWENRSRIDGIAHTHPGTGYPGPSTTDLSTFEAMEAGLGIRIKWWILSASHSIRLEWNPVSPGYDIADFIFPCHEPAWMHDLRVLSFPEMVEPRR